MVTALVNCMNIHAIKLIAHHKLKNMQLEINELVKQVEFPFHVNFKNTMLVVGHVENIIHLLGKESKL